MPNQPLANLIDPKDIPGDLVFLENAAAVALPVLLQNIQYDDSAHIKTASSKGDEVKHELTLITPELCHPIFGSELKLVVCKGATNTSAFPTIFHWKWPLKPYLDKFELQGFDYSPEAFLDVFLLLADIQDKEEFFAEITEAFFGTTDGGYEEFFDEISDTISKYNDNTTAVNQEIQHILAQLVILKQQITQLLNNNGKTIVAIAKNYKTDPALKAIKDAVDSINGSYKKLKDILGIDIEVYKDTVLALFKNIKDGKVKFDRLRALFKKWLGNIEENEIHDFLVPQFDVEVKSVKAALEFPRKWLLPVNDPSGTAVSAIDFPVGTLKYATKTGFDFIHNNGVITFTESYIGKTGIKLTVNKVKPDFSYKANIQEATAEGRPDTFTGAYIEDATITLPDQWFGVAPGNSVTISGKKMLIGEGGFSGEIGLEAGKALSLILGKKTNGNRKGFALELRSFNLIFKQNQIVESGIEGRLTIPKFRQYNKVTQTTSSDPLTINIGVSFAKDGDFSVTAAIKAGLCIALDGLFVVTIEKLEVGRDEGKLYLDVTGGIDFSNNLFLKNLDLFDEDNPFKIKNLRIYSDGTFEIQGGTIPLPESVRLKVKPVEVYITAIHIGAHKQAYQNVERHYKYIGMDAGISVNPGGVKAEGDGMKYYFTVDDGMGKPPHSFFRIEGLSIDLIIPGTASPDAAVLLLKGYLNMKEDEYIGGIKFSLPQARIAGGAEMRYNPDIPAFLIDVNLELPTALPLGNTGMGIFGFRGLFGLRYVAAKDAVTPEAENWFEYYKAPPAKGIRVQKFKNLSKTKKGGTPFSIGAGISLATMSDDGKAFSSQLFLLISIPNLILFEGRANILGERLGIEDTGEPPFYAMIAYSPGDSIITGMGVNYNIPRDGDKPGEILKLKAEIEAAYFFRDSKAWYVHVGTKNKPITAEILSILKGYSYLMLSAYGIEAGAGVHFTMNKTYCGGVVRANGKAYFDVWGRVIFPRSKPDGSGKEPTQFGGGIAAGGSLDVSAFGVGFYLGFSAMLTGEAPEPMRVAGSAELSIAIKLVVKKIEKRFTVEFIWEKETAQNRSAIFALPAATGERATTPVGAVSLKSARTYSIRYFGKNMPTAADTFPIIPINAAVDLQFDKPVLPNAAVAGIIGGFVNAAEGYEDLVPPAKGNRQVLHRYKITAFELKIWENNDWKNYNPYKAMFPALQIADNFKVGYWQKTGGAYNKIRLLAQTPFAYMQQGEPQWYTPEQFGLTPGMLLCKNTGRTRHCALWEREGQTWRPGILHPYQELSFLTTENNSMVAPVLNHAAPRSAPPMALRVQAPGGLELYLPEAAAETRIQLLASSPQWLTITWYAELRDDKGNLTGYEAVASEVKPRSMDATWHAYNNAQKPVSKIVLTPSTPDKAKMAALEIAILEMTDKVLLDPAGNGQLSLARLRGERLTERGKSCYFSLSVQDREDLEAYIRQVDVEWKTGLEKQKKLDLEVAARCGKGLAPSRACANAQQAAAANKALCEQWKQNLDLARQMTSWPVSNPPTMSCFYWVKEVCWLTERDHFYNTQIPGQDKIDADYQAMKDAVDMVIQPLWRPEQKYGVKVTVEDTVDPVKGTQTVWYGFETAKPFDGVLEKTIASKEDLLSANATEKEKAEAAKDDDGPELSLKYYLDFDKCYPNADGRLVYAKPLYYKPDTDTPIVIGFKDAHTRHFFRQWHSTGGQAAENYEMEVLIKDPTEDASPSTGNPLHEHPVLEAADLPAATHEWKEKNAPIALPADLQMVDTLLRSPGACVVIKENGVIVPSGLTPPREEYVAVKAEKLQPEKLYAVIVGVRQKAGGAWHREIHRYNFRTSRYPDFPTHIGSYRQASEEGQQKDMVFSIRTTLDMAEKARILNIAAGMPGGDSVLEAVYQDPVDRIVFGILKQMALPAPVCTEFNFILDKDNNVFGLLMRSPEAFNDPKLPATEQWQTVRLLVNGSEATVQKVFSRDGAQVLLLPTGITRIFPTQQLSVGFAHRMWDPKDDQYKTVSHATAGILTVPAL